MTGAGRPDAGATPPADGAVRLRQYIAGRTPKALTAIENLNRIREKHLQGRCRIEVIDLTADPRVAVRDRIVAIPTRVPCSLTPRTRISGALSDTRTVLAGPRLRSVT